LWVLLGARCQSQASHLRMQGLAGQAGRREGSTAATGGAGPLGGRGLGGRLPAQDRKRSGRARTADAVRGFGGRYPAYAVSGGQTELWPGIGRPAATARRHAALLACGGARPGAGRAASGAHMQGIWTSNTSWHSPHWTEVMLVHSLAWRSAVQFGQVNWYTESVATCIALEQSCRHLFWARREAR